MNIKTQLKTAAEKINAAHKDEREILFADMMFTASKPYGMGFVSVTNKVLERCGINFAHCEKMAEKAGLVLARGSHGMYGKCFVRK